MKKIILAAFAAFQISLGFSQVVFLPSNSGLSTNSYLGINTSTPNALLDVKYLNSTTNLLRVTDQNNQFRWRVAQSFNMFLTSNAGVDIVKIGQDNSFFYSGNFGIGTTSPSAKLDVINQVGETEDLFRARVIDAPDDYIKITNMTSSPGQFIPALYSRHSSDNRQAFYITSAIGSANDAGTDPIVVFDSRLDNGSAAVRPLFAWESYGVRKMVLTASGNLGIGTTPVSSKLHIADGNGGEQLRFSRGTGVVRFAQDMNQDNLYLVNGAASITFMAWKANGNVGIGTQSPDAKLAVKGDIHTQEVKVDLLGSVAPDYVFAPDYNLLPLSEVESYIKANKHLPEVPSAKQMEDEGLNLKEMNLLLLKKVEELTLHLIDLEKEKNKVQNQNDVLSTQVDKLSSDITEIKTLLKK
jgi:hypothetical protein